MKISKKRGRLSIGILGLLFVLAGCADNRVNTQQPGSLKGINTILVLTFDDVTASHGDKGLIKCPLCGNYFEAGPVPQDTPDRLTQTAVDLLRKNTDIPVLIHDRSFAESSNTLPERRFLTEAGKKSRADAVLTGYIYRYEMRTGTDLAVKNPASVALSVHLLRVVDGFEIWSGHIDETQQTLAEDLFKASDFLRRKGRWISADEMAEDGLEQIFESFPEL
jgi:hypothetical protein